MPTLEDIVNQWHMEQPHPKAPSLTVGEFPVATRLATVLKFGSGHAGPQEAANFWVEFKQMNQTLEAQKKLPLGPEEFAQLAQQAARPSYAYHGRPPSMYEITRLRDAKPGEITDYYGSLPDEHYPTVSAADMAKSLAAAQPWASQYLGRTANKGEAAYLHHSGQNPQNYYQQVSNADDDKAGPLAANAGAGIAGGQPTDPRTADPRLAAGAAAAGGPTGVPARRADGAARAKLD